MKTGNGPLDTALAAGERAEHHVTRLGGRDMSPQVENWSLDRSYGTDLPDAMRAFSGVSSAQLDVALTGTGGQPAPALYGPWASRATGDIARPGQSVTHGWGVSGRAADAFRGSVRNRSAESGTDLVRISALDGAERLRQPAQLPRPDGAFSTNSGAAWSHWAASPVWVVDHLLRNAGIHTAPPPRPTCILYASLHGGAAASIGYLDSMAGGWDWWRKLAPFESGVQGSVDSLTTATYVPERLPITRNRNGLWWECWIDTTDTLGSSSQVVQYQCAWEAYAGATTYYLTLRVNFTQGTVTAYCGTNADPTKNPPINWTWTLPKTPGRFHVGLWLETAPNGSVKFIPVITPRGAQPLYFNPGTFVAGSIPSGAMVNIGFGVQAVIAEAFQVSQRAGQPTGLQDVTQEGAWMRTASLDVPVFPLRVIPAVSGTAWSVITEIARATLATAEFDSDGFFRWRNHTRWTSPSSEPDLTVTSARDIAKLTVTEEIDSCRNHCTVRWESWETVKAVPSVLRDEPVPILIRPRTVLTRTFSVDDTMLDPRAPRTAGTDGAGPPNRISLRATASSTSAPILGAVEVKVVRRGGVVTLTAENRTDMTVYYHGASLLSLAPVEYAKPVPSLWSAWNEDSQRYYGVQTYEHDVRGWLQEDYSGKALAEALRNAGAWPVPLLQSVEILPDPRIELGDLVRVIDATGAKLDTLAWVIGNKVTASGGKVTQTLTLRGTTPNGTPADEGLTPDLPTRPNAPPPP